MARAKGGLGRGLDSLFGDLSFDPKPESINEEEHAETAGQKKQKGAAGSSSKAEAHAAESAESVVYVKLGDIKPNSRQPRKQFDEDALEELASSIREHGVIQPVLLRPAAKGYELVAGERRWRAARKAGLKSIPAIVRDLDDRQNSFYALIENMQREDLNIIEEAMGLEQMMDEYGLTQDEAARAVGKSRPYVSNALRLLKLPAEIRDMVSEKKLSAGHARAIAGLQTEELQIEAARLAAEEGWSVRKIEGYTGSRKATKKRPAGRKRKTADIQRVEREMSEKLGTRVSIAGTEVRGMLQLEYYSRDELEALVEILMADK